MFDILIKGGTIVDGTGATPYTADLAINDGRIVGIGADLGDAAREVVDAAGRLVTPGFIDPHTHYDGQATWDPDLLPSSAHGVTTVVIGSCGIGFAPLRPGTQDWLVTLMEGVEDIPGTALHVGIPWNWETFPEYLDALEQLKYKVDVAAHVPHSTVRAYVLGKRAEADEPATAEELEQMAAIVGESIAAGAVGLATSRVSLHRGSDGGIVPGTKAPEEELLALTTAMRDAGGGVLQMIPSGAAGGVEGQEGENVLAGLSGQQDKYSLSTEIRMMRRIHVATGQPVTFTLAENAGLGEEEYRKALEVVAESAAAGERVRPQFSPRPVGLLMSLETYHAFTARPGYRAIADLPLAERAARMADPAVKAAILSEADVEVHSTDPFKHIHTTFQRNLDAIFDLATLNYEPDPADSMAARAAVEGRDPLEVCYETLIAGQGQGVLIWFSTGYSDGDLRKKEECLLDPTCVMGLGDGGAHVQVICDASFPTFLLYHWGKKRVRGQTLPVELLVHRLTQDPAELYGLDDRGILAEGLRADVNVIDFDRLSISLPRLVQDLPANAQRLLQDSTGYDMTIVNGVVTRRNDEPTDAYPGRLVRRKHKAIASPTVAELA